MNALNQILGQINQDPSRIDALLASMSREDQLATLALLEAAESRSSRNAAQEDFGTFCERVMPGFQRPLHIQIIIDALEKVERGELKRLILALPPRHGKSETTSKLFLAWYMGRNANREIAFATYNQEYANQRGRAVRDLMASSEYQEVFPDAAVKMHTSASQRFETANKNQFFAVGVGGPLTGRGAHCFPAGTLVETEKGLRRIEHIAKDVDAPRVLSYDHKTKRTVWSRVIASQELKTDALYTIRTTSGRTLRATADHPIYVRGFGYRQAQDIRPGDPLLGKAVAQEHDVPELRERQDRQGGDLPRVLHRTAGTNDGTDVCVVREGLCPEDLRGRKVGAPRAYSELLLKVLQREAPRGEEQPKMRNVRGFGSVPKSSVLRCVLSRATYAAQAVIDDPIKNREEADSPNERARLIAWYQSAFRTRLHPGGAIILIATRWHLADLTGYVLSENEHENWEVLEFPAILDEPASQLLGRPIGTALWPERYNLDELHQIRTSVGTREWTALYQQKPVPNGGGVIERDWLRWWGSDKPPECSTIIASWDTAYGQTRTSDFSAVTVWGTFQHEDIEGNSVPCAILLGARRGRWKFGDLKAQMIEIDRKFGCDFTLVESKGPGLSTIQELRSLGLPMKEYVPRGSKEHRLDAVSPFFEQGRIYIPKGKEWADDYIEQLCNFPASRYDDYVDATSQALRTIRLGGGITTTLDAEPMRRSGGVKGYW
jgi:predicted phage terminase large subunit-like protein